MSSCYQMFSSGSVYVWYAHVTQMCATVLDIISHIFVMKIKLQKCLT